MHQDEANWVRREIQKALRDRKHPCGFYTMGMWIPDESSNYPVVKRWSCNGFRALHCGEEYTFEATIDRPTKVMTVHAYGACRLVSASVGTMILEPIGGALFLEFDKAFQPGNRLRVMVQAFEFEPLSDPSCLRDLANDEIAYKPEVGNGRTK